MSKNNVTLKLSSPGDTHNRSKSSSSTTANKIRKVNKADEDDSEAHDILAVQFIFISGILGFRNLTRFSNKGHCWNRSISRMVVFTLHKFIQNCRTNRTLTNKTSKIKSPSLWMRTNSLLLCRNPQLLHHFPSFKNMRAYKKHCNLYIKEAMLLNYFPVLLQDNILL